MHSYHECIGFGITHEYRLSNHTGTLPMADSPAKYDALLAVHHACGHHLIAHSGILSVALLRHVRFMYIESTYLTMRRIVLTGPQCNFLAKVCILRTVLRTQGEVECLYKPDRLPP